MTTGVKTYNETFENRSSVIDDLDNNTMSDNNTNFPTTAADQPTIAVDEDKLAALKAKMAKKETPMTAKIVAKRERSIEFGVVGTGQAGSNLAERFFKLNYPAIAVNTASQDLKFLEMPEENKLLLNHTIGGAAKERSIGNDAALANRQEIYNLVHDKLNSSMFNILCTSLGGGSGSGSIEAMIDVLNEFGKPVIVIAVLPMGSEDLQAKNNALEALSEIAKMTQSKKVANLILVDNAKIEAIFHDVNQMDFFDKANASIVEQLDMLNVLSSMNSKVKGMDSMEFAKILIDGEGLTTYGVMEVSNLDDNLAIAEAVVNNLEGSMLADLDPKQAKYVSYCVIANSKTWQSIPAVAINTAAEVIKEATGSALVFKGLYQVEEVPDGVVRVYTIVVGCGLPSQRVSSLKTEVDDLNKVFKTKMDGRNVNLTLDLGKTKSTSTMDKIKQDMSRKQSAFGKFVGVTDKRKG